jgi:signal transduction histidine kinase
VTLLASARWRFIVGSLLWTAGLLFFAHMTFVGVMFGIDEISEASHVGVMSSIATISILVGLVITGSGLSPFKQLRQHLAAVHAGKERRVEGSYPSEVQPLVDDLNALLELREKRVREALAQAGDLAHGLKTPLAVLAQEAERADAAGHADLAQTMRQQIDRMRRQMDYHLAHARAAASGAAPGARCSLLESADGLVRTLRRLHAERGLTIDVDVPEDHSIRAQREDVDEMLGNLLDNACKWARTRVTLTSSRNDRSVIVVVDDDGAGIDPSMREAVLQRGVRADEASPGSGLGLAIVRDLAALYGGSVVLEGAPLGGLRARLQLPAA